MTTIVTAYFKLPLAKASHDTYVQWMQNMLAIDNPMVIFCDAESVPLITSFRATKTEKTRIIPTTFSEFYTYRYAATYNAHYQMDAEQRVGHNPYLYAIWGEKSNFLKRAIELDPFHSDYFVWVDIGCFRIPNTQYIQWPNPARVAEMPKDKVLLLAIAPFTEEELKCRSRDNLPLFQYTNRISAPIFGGTKAALSQWHTLYYEMLEYFISIGRFIGKDQSIMNSVYLLHRDQCELVSWKLGCHDPWFYLQDYLK
jgi:hypothetical protein